MEKIIHQGRNVKRFREMLGIKQEALAVELGEEWNQRKVSVLEGKEVIDDELLEQIANALRGLLKQSKILMKKLQSTIFKITMIVLLLILAPV